MRENGGCRDREGFPYQILKCNFTYFQEIQPDGIKVSQCAQELSLRANCCTLPASDGKTSFFRNLEGRRQADPARELDRSHAKKFSFFVLFEGAAAADGQNKQ